MSAGLNIEFDNESKIFYPGQTITGRVTFVGSSEQLTSRGVIVSCGGLAVCDWRKPRKEKLTTETHYNSMQKSYENTPRYNPITVKEPYFSSEIIFHINVTLFGDGVAESMIPFGKNVYPFTITLPNVNIPCSFNGAKGQVKYQIAATVMRSWALDIVVAEPFIVKSIVDLTVFPTAPALSQAGVSTASKTFCCCCCTSGPLSLEVRLPKTGFAVGEKIFSVIEINNQSGRKISKVTLSLVQSSIFWTAKGNKTNKSKVKELITKIGDPLLGTVILWEGEPLEVPDEPPTHLGGKCSIIDIQYAFEVELHASVNLKASIPVVIGTVAIKQFNIIAETPYSPQFPPAFPPLTKDQKDCPETVQM